MNNKTLQNDSNNRGDDKPNTLLRKVHLIMRFALGLLFITAGLTKLWNFSEFVSTVGDFGIVLDGAVKPFATIVCLAELICGFGLLFYVRGSLFILALLVCCFIAALAYGKVLGLDIDCGCLGPGYHVSLLTQIIIDVFILAGLGIVFVTGRNRLKINSR